MQKNTDNNISTQKRCAAISAIVISVLVLMYIGGLILLIAGIEDNLLNGIVLLYTVIGIAVIIGVFIALKQRFREINSGEAEEAKKY